MITKEDFLKNIDPKHKEIIERLLPIIEKHDTNLKQGVVKIMGSDMLGYKQNNEFKYAFASHPNHLSFHNMVMYCYPELNKKYKSLFNGVKFQKACINFSSTENFPVELFEEYIKDSVTFQYPSELQLKKKNNEK